MFFLMAFLWGGVLCAHAYGFWGEDEKLSETVDVDGMDSPRFISLTRQEYSGVSATLYVIREILTGPKEGHERFSYYLSDAVYFNGKVIVTKSILNKINYYLRLEPFESDTGIWEKRVIKVFTDRHSSGVGYIRHVTFNMNLAGSPVESGFTINRMFSLVGLTVSKVTKNEADQNELVYIDLESAEGYDFISDTSTMPDERKVFIKIPVGSKNELLRQEKFTLINNWLSKTLYFPASFIPFGLTSALNMNLLEFSDELLNIVTEEFLKRMEWDNITRKEIVALRSGSMEDSFACTETKCSPLSDKLLGHSLSPSNRLVLSEIKNNENEYRVLLYGFTGDCAPNGECDISLITPKGTNPICGYVNGWMCFEVTDFHFWGLLDFDPINYVYSASVEIANRILPSDAEVLKLKLYNIMTFTFNDLKSKGMNHSAMVYLSRFIDKYMNPYNR